VRCSSWSGSRPAAAFTGRGRPGTVALVGRQAEVEALQQALAQAGAGQGQVSRFLASPGGQITPGLRVPPFPPYAGLAVPGE